MEDTCSDTAAPIRPTTTHSRQKERIVLITEGINYQPGDVVNGHIYKIATDGRCYWYPMTDEEQRQHRIRRMEDDLGMGS